MKTILIVDDEKEIRDLLAKKLIQENFSVLTASNWEETRDAAKTNNPDLILLDIAMPVVDGYMTCEMLKKDPQTKNIAVLFLTDKDLQPKAMIEHCQDLSASGFISKFSTLKDLVAKIKEILP